MTANPRFVDGRDYLAVTYLGTEDGWEGEFTSEEFARALGWSMPRAVCELGRWRAAGLVRLEHARRSCDDPTCWSLSLCWVDARGDA